METLEPLWIRHCSQIARLFPDLFSCLLCIYSTMLYEDVLARMSVRFHMVLHSIVRFSVRFALFGVRCGTKSYKSLVSDQRTNFNKDAWRFNVDVCYNNDHFMPIVGIIA